MSKPKIRIVTATEAKNKFGEMIKHAYASAEHLIVEKSGIPVVAIIPMSDYEQLVPQAEVDAAERVAAASRREEASRKLGELLERRRIESVDIDEEEAERIINDAVAAVRAEHNKKLLAAERREKYKPSRPSRRTKG